MSTQTYSGKADQTPVIAARKDWREIYAQKRAKHNDPRYLRTGRIHEDINEAAHIWRIKTQTVTGPANSDNAKEQRMTDGRVPTVATANVPNCASLPTVAYSGTWDAWLRSYGTWKEGLSEARCDAREVNEVGGGDLRYPAGQDFPGSIVNDKFIPRLAFAREMHHRTPSTSTASSSSLKTEHNGDWWEDNSPWAWQWVDVESQKVGGKVTTQEPVVDA